MDNDTLTTQQDEETTLRDDLAAAFDEIEAAPAEGVKAAEIPGDTAAEKSERARNEKGQFTKAEQEAADKAAKADATAETPPIEVKPKYTRPSTWRKETHGIWDKLNKGEQLTVEEIDLMAQEAIKRDQDFAKGVSTYKHEAERAKELWGAIEPFMPDLQQNNINPSQWIQNLGNAHRTLALGSPVQKLQMFQQLAQSYGVPLQALLPQQQQGADGQPVQSGGLSPEYLQIINPLFEQVNQLRGQLNSYQTQQQQATQAQLNANIAKFATDKPHFEQVRETMAQLLESGLADDLDDAYQAAVRHPRHDDIFQAMQQQQSEEKARKDAEAKANEAARARKSAVSTRSTTPTGQGKGANGTGNLRATIGDAFEQHTGGRV